MTAEDYGLARRMWHQLEPVHAVFWYAPEVFAEAAALGYEVKTRWPGYFACSVLTDYQAHYNTARPHQGIAQRVPDSEHGGGHPTIADLDRERIHRKPVLSGLINEYTRAA